MPGRDPEPEAMSEEGAGARAGLVESPADGAVTLNAALVLSDFVCFLSFLRIGQLRLMWSELWAELWQNIYLPLFTASTFFHRPKLDQYGT